MNNQLEPTPFSRAVLGGLATGVTSVAVNLIYNFIFRGITQLSLTFSYINVAIITFASFLFCLAAGLVYQGVVHYLGKSRSLYSVILLVLTVLLIIPAFGFHRGETPGASAMFSTLYGGVILLNGLLCAFILPWYATHKNYFFDV